MQTYEVAVNESSLVVYRIVAKDPTEARLHAAAKGDKTFTATRMSTVRYVEEVR